VNEKHETCRHEEQNTSPPGVRAIWLIRKMTLSIFGRKSAFSAIMSLMSPACSSQVSFSSPPSYELSVVQAIRLSDGGSLGMTIFLSPCHSSAAESRTHVYNTISQGTYSPAASHYRTAHHSFRCLVPGCGIIAVLSRTFT
jgi:hypothetical protein